MKFIICQNICCPAIDLTGFFAILCVLEQHLAAFFAQLANLARQTLPEALLALGWLG